MNMDCISNQDDNIRKIEDIIDIQKAKGKYDERQVVFNLPSDNESIVGANVARSLESGFTDKPRKKKLKKSRPRQHHSPMPDVITWPSDSDITVLRMKLCVTNSELKEKIGSLVPGDGLHHPDSSSMVNLATLMKQSQSHSKHSLVDEYLLPLTSWEVSTEKTQAVTEDEDKSEPSKAEASSPQFGDDEVLSLDRVNYGLKRRRWRIARFLRIYFCPCCACLYKFEKPSDEFTQTRPIQLQQALMLPTPRNFD